MKIPANASNDLLRDALNKMREMKAEIERLKSHTSRTSNEGIAVLGCGMRLPGGVRSLEQYADLLFEGRVICTPVPESRWNSQTYYSADADAPGKTYARNAAFLEDVSGFDPQFFGISPREAIDLDPQQRLLLETVWEAMECAGVAPEQLRGTRTGVYVALSMDDYLQVSTDGLDLSQVTASNSLGNAKSLAAGRISYTFDLIGPCLQLDTACSSSLVAIHLARQALLSGEIDFAIVGAANLMLSPMGSIGFSKMKALSPDGRCKPFDESADGYGRGEGVAAVLLQRITDATAQGSRILGIIRSTAVNHDGKSNGLTAPNGRRQEELLHAALKAANVEPKQVLYVEAHGTGTPLGDPIELSAIGNVYALPDMRDSDLIVGSVKANIGHMEAAAGLASLLKLLVIAAHRSVPAMPPIRQLNQHIAWDRYRIRVDHRAAHKFASSEFLVAASCFGMSGTNAHLLLAGPPPIREDAGAQAPQLLCLSARDEGALRALVDAYVQWLERGEASRLEDVCYTATVGRNHFEWRAAFVADDVASLRLQLQAFAGGRRMARVLRPSLRFAAQWPQGVANELAATVPLYARHLSEVCAALQLQWEQCTPAQQTYVAQYALAQMLRSLGVTMAGFAGEGTGSLAAAAQAGRMTLEEGFAGANDSADLRADPEPAEPVLAFGEERAGSARTQLLRLLAELYQLGTRIDWPVWYAPDRHRRLSLPTYPFQRKTYWKTFNASPVAGTLLDMQRRLSGGLRRIVEEHRFFDVPVAPGALYLSLCHAALRDSSDKPWIELYDVVFVAPLIFNAAGADDRNVRLQWPSASSELVLDSGPELVHMRTRVRLSNTPPNTPARAVQPDVAAHAVDGARLYEAQQRRFLSLGPVLRWVDSFCVKDGEVLATLVPPPECGDDAQLGLHPGIIDSCFQLLRPLIDDSEQTLIPIGISRVIFKRLPKQVRTLACRAWLRGKGTAKEGVVEVYADGDLVMVMEAPRAEAIDAEKLLRQNIRPETALFEWSEQVLPMPPAAEIEPRKWLFAGADPLKKPLEDILEQCGATVLPSSDVPTPESTADNIVWLCRVPDATTAEAVTAFLDSAMALVKQLAGWGRAVCLHVITIGDCPMARQVHESMSAVALAASTEISSIDMVCWNLPEKPRLEILHRAVAQMLAGAGPARFDEAGLAYARRLKKLRFEAISQATPDWHGKACLVTGAGGALGEILSRHLAMRGVERLYATGRGMPNVDRLRNFIHEQGLRCEVIPLRLDVTLRAEVETLFQRISHETPTLRGIFHLAGVLEDRAVLHVDRDNIERVFAPKALGAWYLHEATLNLKLDAFVCFSSAASVLPSAGQSVYGAANAFLNGLCAARRAQGLPGRSLCWGPWDSEGMATGLNEATVRVMSRQGVELLRTHDALAALDRVICTADADMLVIGCTRPAAVEMAANERTTHRPKSEKHEDPALEITEEYLTALAAQVLETADTPLDSNRPLEEFGMDSLASMDMIEQLNERLSEPLPLTTRLMELSIQDLLALVRNSNSPQRAQQNAGEAASHRYVRGDSTPEASRRLLCLHYLGGEESCFSTWSERMGSSTEVRTVNWPRTAGMGMTELAGRIAQELCALPPLPLYIYGHSMGGLLAYEVASRFAGKHGAMLRALVVGAMWSPDEHRQTFLHEVQDVDSLVQRLSPKEEQAQMLLSHASWRQTAEADWAMMQRYSPEAPPALDCDVMALAGEDDPLVLPIHLQGWQRLCKRRFEFQLVPGDHFFIHDAGNVTAVLQTLMMGQNE